MKIPALRLHKTTKTKLYEANSAEQLNYLRSMLAQDGPPFENLERTWRESCKGLPSDYVEMLEHHNSTPVEELLDYFESGINPPPEILISIAECFEFYFACEGKVTLEEIFFDKPRKGVGNYAAAKSNEAQLSRLHFHMMMTENKAHWASIDGKFPKNQLEAVEYFQALNPKESVSIEPESLLREYRRWKKRRADSNKPDK